MNLRAAEYCEKGMDLRVEAVSRCDSVLTEVGAYSEENTDLSFHDKDSLRVVNHQVIVIVIVDRAGMLTDIRTSHISQPLSWGCTGWF